MNISLGFWLSVPASGLTARSECKLSARGSIYIADEQKNNRAPEIVTAATTSRRRRFGVVITGPVSRCSGSYSVFLLFRNRTVRSSVCGEKKSIVFVRN